LLALGFMLALALVFVPESASDRPRVAEYAAVLGGYAWVILSSLLATALVPFAVGFLRRPLWTVVALALTSAVFLGVVDRGFSYLDHKRSVKELAMVLKPLLQAGDEVITYQEYYQDLPVYIERRITVVDWKGELKFGTEVEDVSSWMIDKAAFWRHWDGPHRAYLLTGQGNYDKLRAEGRGRFHLIAQTGSNVLVTNRMGQP
jgi:hypothetical protein